MTKNQQIISKLNELWGKCIVGHHKNSDSNHYIYQKYSFGHLTYVVEHYAYVGDDINGTFSTLEAAENYLITELSKQIREQVEFNLNKIANGDEEELSYLDKPDPKYWEEILSDTQSILRLQEPQSVNWEERALKAERDYYYLKNIIDYAEEQLNNYNVPKYDKEFPEMKYSIGHRIQLLKEKK